MPDFQHIRLHISAATQDIGLRLRLGISHKKEAVLPVLDFQHDGIVVGILIAFFRPQNRAHGVTQLKTVPRLRHSVPITLLLHGIHYIPVGRRILGYIRHHHRPAVELIKNHIQTADMIRIRMGADSIFQLRHTLLPEIILNLRTLVVIPGVNQHGFAVARYQDAVSLTHIQIVNRHLRYRSLFFLSGCLHTGCPGIAPQKRNADHGHQQKCRQLP